MEVRGYMDGGEAIFVSSGFSGTGPGWRWNINLETWMGLRWCLYGSEIQLLVPGSRWDVIWMEVRCKYRELDWGELGPGWMPGVNLTPCCDDFIPPPSRWQIASIQVTIIAYQLHSVPISMPPLHVLSHQHLGSCFISIHVSSDLNQGP